VRKRNNAMRQYCSGCCRDELNSNVCAIGAALRLIKHISLIIATNTYGASQISCKHVGIYINMYINLYINLYINIYVHMYIHIYAHVYIHIHIHLAPRRV